MSDLGTADLIATLQIGPVPDGTFVPKAAYSPDGTLIVTAASELKMWHADGAAIGTLEGHTDWIESVDFAPNGSRLVTASWDGTAKVWGSFPVSELVDQIETRLGDREFTKSECDRFDIEPCPA